jgi:uncharacterized phage infection (PIP) family protein YhgE
LPSGPSAQLASNTRSDSHSSQFQSGSQDVAKETKEQAAKLKDQASDIASHAQEQATEAFSSMKDKVRETAEEQKSAGADRVKGVAHAMNTAADELQKQMPGAADYVREAASGIDRMSSSLRNKSVDEMVGAVSDFARTQPAAFFGATVLAGFALSRFLKSSAESHGSGSRVHTASRPEDHHAHYGSPL